MPSGQKQQNIVDTQSVEGEIARPAVSHRYELRSLVLQPTGFCNISCRYCYLANRENPARMQLAVARTIASRADEFGSSLNLVWHAGEPLSVGEPYLRELFECFEPLRRAGRVVHAIQTNGTLIDDAWCAFFKEFAVSIGLSIDGPAHLNRERVDRAGRETFERVIRGAEALKRHGVPFSTISVVSSVEPEIAGDLLIFLRGLGGTSAAFNVVERDGASLAVGLDDVSAGRFWRELRLAWERDPDLPIREVQQVLEFARFNCLTPQAGAPAIDWLLSIDFRGRVRALSPELMEMRSERYNDYVVADVAHDTLETAIANARRSAYVQEFFAGIERCAAQCDYFAFCRGGSLSNKLAEQGDAGATETRYCKQSRQLVWDAFAPMLLEEC